MCARACVCFLPRDAVREVVLESVRTCECVGKRNLTWLCSLCSVIFSFTLSRGGTFISLEDNSLFAIRRAEKN